MSLNWKEINLVLEELDLPGSRIQKVYQCAYDVIIWELYKKGSTRRLLIALTPGACRLHSTATPPLKGAKPLRFAEFCKSHLLNGWIEEAVQLGNNRIIRFSIHSGLKDYRCYLRLWSNAANIIVTDEQGVILDAMRRSPKRGEISGGRYAPEETSAAEKTDKEYAIRELPGDASFNEKLDAWYREHGEGISLEALRIEARKRIGRSLERLEASLKRLHQKEADYENAVKYREYGDIILAHTADIRPGDQWLHAENYYSRPGEMIKIKIDPKKPPAESAAHYYEQYRKAKNGLTELREDIASGLAEEARLKTRLEALLSETNPLRLHQMLKTAGGKASLSAAEAKRPGLAFTVENKSGDWLIIVGRDAKENDELLRRFVKGRDLWLHVRDYAGSYVFIKYRSGKSVPLDVLLDAGNLALFYSKGRNNASGDLYYTSVKYLRRVKNGPKGLVIPTQEKNLHISLDPARLRRLEGCRIRKQP
jgi:predicted ribosome quality control (RQC) complex YloA/Tae2 family protein